MNGVGQVELSLVLDAIPVPIFYKDAQGIYRGCNEAFQRFLGRSRDEIIGQAVEGVAPPELASVYRSADEALFRAGGTQTYEARVRYADGTLHDVIFSKAVFQDASGRLAGLVGSILDITERKRAEQALLVNNRMAALGTLAAGAAHELNNALTYIVTSLRFVRQQLQAGVAPDVLEALGDASDGVERVSRIVRDFRGLARVGEERAAVDLEWVIRTTADLARDELGGRATLGLDLGPLPPVQGSAPRLSQVLLNLLQNAVQAMPDRPCEANRISVSAHARGGRVVIEVRDNGAGIPAAIRDRIFEPFFTTRPPGAGTGLGLSICQQIVGGLGGEIEIVSEPGEGTVARVVLPAAGARAAARR